MITLRLRCVYTAPTLHPRPAHPRPAHYSAQQAPVPHAQVRASRLQPTSDSDYRYASRSVPLPNGEADFPSEIAPPQARSAQAGCRTQRAAKSGAAPARPYAWGAPGGSRGRERQRAGLSEG